MSYEASAKPAAAPHNLTMEDRKKLKLSGVEEVESFDDKEVVMLTTGGCLVIRGEGLSIGKLDTVSGQVDVSGHINELSYEEPATGGLWSRLFH